MRKRCKAEELTDCFSFPPPPGENQRPTIHQPPADLSHGPLPLPGTSPTRPETSPGLPNAPCSPVLRPSRLSAHPWPFSSSSRGSEEPAWALAGPAAFLTPEATVQASRCEAVVSWSAHQCLLGRWRLTSVPDWWAGETRRN